MEVYLNKTFIYLILAGLSFCAFVRYSPYVKNTQPGPGQINSDTIIPPFALMEIFTTEGCSNCPPAYKVVETVLANGKQYHQQVLLLDFHVDYNNVPWMDPYSNPEYT